MCARAGVTVCMVVMVFAVSKGAPDTSNTWIRAQPQQVSETLHGLMVSIDGRLQTLENVRWELTMKQAEQRLDTLESSVRRLDSTVQERLDKLERNLNSKELKDELTVEKLTLKIRDVMDSSYDRYNRRLGYMEEKLEMVLKKMQMTMEGSFNRLGKQQEDTQTEVLEAVSLLEDLKSQTSTTEDKLNHTHKAIEQHIQRLISPSREELQKISGSLDHLGSRLNASVAPIGPWVSQNDSPLTSDVVTTLRREIGLEGTKITSKINNMYNDLWRRVVSIEALIKDLNRATNTSYREVLQEMRSLRPPENRDFPGDSQENFLEVALEALERKLQRKLQDLGRKVDERFDTLSATQNLIMDSYFDGEVCHGLESRLSQVLEKMFDIFSEKIEGFSNRTLDLDRLVMEMMELVKSQHSQLIRTVTHNTNMVVTLAKDSSNATKQLHHSVTRLGDKTEDSFQELHDEVRKILVSSKICLEDKKPIKVEEKEIPENNTEGEIVLLSTTEVTMPLLNVPESKNETVKTPDTGILKITTDDVRPLADNSSMMASASMLKPVVIKPSRPLTVDSSILQIIELMSSNLTQNQKYTLLRFLNTTISLENLEAVIQNTEAEQDYDNSVEIYDLDTLNKTGVEEESKNYQAIALTSDISMEENNTSDETNYDLVQNGVAANDQVLLMNSTPHPGIDSEGKLTHKLDMKDQVISEDLKTLLNYYTTIMKIKQGNLTTSDFWNPHQQEGNSSDVHNRQESMERLCYGQDNIQSFASDLANTKMRGRLLLINQILSDKDLYEKIENICNTMTESLAVDDASEETLLNH